MGNSLLLPEGRTFPVQPLTEKECDSVLAEAYVLMKDEHANAVSVEHDRQYIIVFDRRGETYFISRTAYGDYILERNGEAVFCSQRFEEVLEALPAAVKANQTPGSRRRASKNTGRQPFLASA